VKLVTAKLRSTGQEQVLGVDACFDVSVRLVMPGLLDLDGQCADHRVALTLADKGSRKIHEPAALSPYREPLCDPGREGRAKLRVGCKPSCVFFWVASPRIESIYLGQLGIAKR
jgi:hypothetical protein